MADKHRNTRVNRTLLIILGILIAVLLTLNARSLSFAELQGNSLSKPFVEKPTPKTSLTIGKVPSLEKFFNFVSQL